MAHLSRDELLSGNLNLQDFGRVCLERLSVNFAIADYLKITLYHNILLVHLLEELRRHPFDAVYIAIPKVYRL